ncbi:unnamed protein product, partial [Adineta steineri]
MIIEDSFVNSQEWTLSRSVLDIRIGLLGTLTSGKSALVHRFLTGTYMQEESPEGGRFKKEINIDNQSYLLLIRDEAGVPDTQFTHWIDAVIFVFSLENEESFKTIYQYYTKMNHYRNISDMPLILVGTQDAISESNPRVIHEDRARKLANELKRCTYYETCATYGLNVERIFHDVCQKIIQQRYGFSTSTLSSSSNRSITPQQQSPISNQIRILSSSHSIPASSHFTGNINLSQTTPASVFSSYHYEQHQPPNLSPATQNLAVAQLAQCFNTNSSFIKSEIERFESVHPSIYSIYELIDEFKDQLKTQAQIREHVMIIEDSFVNSQEWTLSRSVLDIRIGLLGTLTSGKSALVHRFLTGTYMQEESPEGGRFKKEINIDNQSYLLLIRDEAGVPDTQFTHWIDAVIFVFSLENEESFKTIYQYYTKMNHYRNITDMPLILVGTQDAISESNPRVIHEDRARKLANELKRCTYYETCATYGLNVERIFHDVCQKIIQQRYGFSTSTLSSSSNRSITPQQQSPISNQIRILSSSHSIPASSHFTGNINLSQTTPASVFSSYHYEQHQP